MRIQKCPFAFVFAQETPRDRSEFLRSPELMFSSCFGPVINNQTCSRRSTMSFLAIKPWALWNARSCSCLAYCTSYARRMPGHSRWHQCPNRSIVAALVSGLGRQHPADGLVFGEDSLCWSTLLRPVCTHMLNRGTVCHGHLVRPIPNLWLSFPLS